MENENPRTRRPRDIVKTKYTPAAIGNKLNAEAIAEALACGRSGCQCGRREGKGFKTHCPAHDDSKPSLSLTDADDGKGLVHCKAGCPQDALIAALREQGLWPKQTSRNSARHPGVKVTRCEVRDVNGVHVATHARKGTGDSKRVWWERPDGKRSDGDVHSPTLPLYGAERLRSVVEGARVVVTEGEKAADAQARRGIPAPGTVTGAGLTPCDDALRPLLPYTVVLWPDNDDPGRGHMQRVAESLTRMGHRNVRVLSWPDAPENGDAADFAGGDGAALAALLDSARPYEPPPPIDGAALLEDVRVFVRRYVVLGDAQADAVALWTVHTHAFDAAECTPYLNIRSPEKQSGKTRLQEVLETLVARPWRTSGTSRAALMRRVNAQCPTLLLDETDAAFKGDKEYSEALRGMLNAGYRRGGTYTVCDTGKGNAVCDFNVFCPKAIAGVGDLPDTVRDRSIPIDMKRKTPTEHAERFRARKAPGQAAPLRGRIAQWAAGYVAALRDVEPQIPDALSDRAADVWEPLFAIADTCGGDWPERARKSASTLSAGEPSEDASIGVRLLADIQDVFKEKDTDRLFSADLVAALNAIEESLWGDWYGKPMGPQTLAKMLRPYKIKPNQVRIGDESRKGYDLAWFEDAFACYIPQKAETGETPETKDSPEYERARENVSGVSGPGGIHARPDNGLRPTDGPLVRYAVEQMRLPIVGRRQWK